MIIILSISPWSSFGVASHPAPLTNSCQYVDAHSQGQDYSNDLTEPPLVFAGLYDWAIAMDLETP